MNELKKQQGILQHSKTTEILDQIRGSAKITLAAASDMKMKLWQM